MLLLIDVGNTNITIGVCGSKGITGPWRLTSGCSRTADEMGLSILGLMEHSGIENTDIKNVIISSVVPKLMYSLTHGIRKYFRLEPMVVSRGLELGIKLLKPATKELGADRIVNAAAAYKLYGGPVITVDYGTATTYDVVSEDGEFITGITAPGIKISADALFERAALLGEIELVLPPSIVAENTVESLQCGILYGCIGETEYIVSRLKRELDMPKAVVTATGGLSRVIAQGAAVNLFDRVEPMLTLEGLRIIHEMNS